MLNKFEEDEEQPRKVTKRERRKKWFSCAWCGTRREEFMTENEICKRRCETASEQVPMTLDEEWQWENKILPRLKEGRER